MHLDYFSAKQSSEILSRSIDRKSLQQQALGYPATTDLKNPVEAVLSIASSSTY
jgi:hypothetical protein